MPTKIDAAKKGANGGVSCRMGINFYTQIEMLKDEKLKNGSSKDRIATEKITNLIVRHKAWKDIFKDISISPQEEVNHYGL